jgi:conjugal transfer pilus assembly protein TraD
MMRIENPYRDAHEWVAAGAWLLAAVVALIVLPVASVPRGFLAMVAVFCFAIAGWRTWQALSLWHLHANLLGRGIEHIAPAWIAAWMARHPDRLYLGQGFDWEPKHVQRMHDLRGRSLATILPPAWYLKFRARFGGTATGQDQRGEAWIHGVERHEREISLPLRDLAGNTVIFGTTGSGKTRFFELISTQIIHRPQSVLMVIDPKGDRAWRERLQLECARIGKPFMHFHPAFPARSVRLDPLRNWQRPTELASRVSSLIRGETGDSVFKDFAWRAINQIVEALIEIEERPNLLKLRRFIEGGPDHLLEQVLTSFFRKRVPDFEARIEPYRAKGAPRAAKRSDSPAASQVAACVAFYKTEIREAERSSAVDGLVSMYEHNRDHQMRLIASLLPLLAQLTSGTLGPLLSPEPDPQDARPILDTNRVIEGRYVLYVGLDALSDSAVSAAIGAILLADLASVAGHRYNHGGDAVEVSIMVDESAEVITPPFIQLLNKARGAGFRTYFAAQTKPDFVARTGNSAMASMILGNANNLIALRTHDEDTQEHIVSSFGTTTVRAISASQSSSARTVGNPASFSGGVTERLTETEVDVFAADRLGKLPDLHFVANISGGRIVKGRLPLLIKERTPTLDEMEWLPDGSRPQAMASAGVAGGHA